MSVQFEAAYAAASVHQYLKVGKILRWYGYPFWILNHNKHLKKYVSFTPSQLLDYFKQHQDLCERMLIDCGDKRYSPSTFIEGTSGRFVVGYFDADRMPMKSDMFYFGTIEEAVTDYVLFSLEMPRLK